MTPPGGRGADARRRAAGAAPDPAAVPLPSDAAPADALPDDALPDDALPDDAAVRRVAEALARVLVPLPRNRASRPDPVAACSPWRAAVLVPIALGPGPPAVLLTRRAATLRHHPGQVSLPGGRIDPRDADAAGAALREAGEEIGLDRAAVRILGRLPPVFTTTGFTIEPVVGLLDHAAGLRPSPDEVEAILSLPIRTLLDPSQPVREQALVDGRVRAWWVWPHETDRIWGATAAILKTLADRLGAAACLPSGAA